MNWRQIETPEQLQDALMETDPKDWPRFSELKDPELQDILCEFQAGYEQASYAIDDF